MDAQDVVKDVPNMAVAAAVIAGGRGRRLGGIAKGLLVVHGQRIIDRQLALLRTLFGRVMVVANDPSAYFGLPVPVVPDARGVGIGPIAGIETALATLLAHERAVVCVAADMPFVSLDVLRMLRDHDGGAAAVVPQVLGQWQPLCARYDRAALPIARACIDRGSYRLMDLVAELAAVPLPTKGLGAEDAAGRFATNINTPDDLERAIAASAQAIIP